MIIAQSVPLGIDRGAPRVFTIEIIGIDLTGADLHAQIRLTRDAPGDPIVDLPKVTDPTIAGVRLVATDTSGTLPVSWIRLQIPAMATGTGAGQLPPAAELGEDVIVYWDMFVTPAGRTTDQWFYGPVTISATVTKWATLPALVNDPLPGADAVANLVGADLTVTLAGAALIQPLIDRADGSAAAAIDAAARAETKAQQASDTAALVQQQVGLALPKAGGTMTGPIVMGSNKVTGLGAGTADDHAVNLGQMHQELAGKVSNGAAVSTLTETATAKIMTGAERDYVASLPSAFLADPMPLNGNFADGGNGEFQPAPAGGIVATADAWLNTIGATRAAKINAGTSAAWSPTLTRRCYPGSYFAVAINMVSSAAGAWPSLGSSTFRLILVDPDGVQIVNSFFSASEYVEIDSTHRRYLKVVQIPARADGKPLSSMLLSVTAPAGADLLCAYEAGYSKSKPADIDRLFDPFNTRAQNNRLTALESRATAVEARTTALEGSLQSVPAIAAKGNLPAIDLTQFGGGNAGSGTLQASTDTVFTGYGCVNEVVFGATAASTANFIVNFPRRVRPQEWYIASYLVRSPDGVAWPSAATPGNYRVIAFDTANVQTAAGAYTSFEQIDATHRRYFVVAQNVGTTDWVKAWICVGGANLAFTGFALGLSNTKPGALNWEDFDPGQTTAQNNRLAALEARPSPALPAASAIPVKGNLPTIDTTQFVTVGSGALQASTDTVFTGYGCVNEVLFGTTTTSTANFIVVFPRRLRPQQWVAMSVLVRSPDGAAWPTVNSAMFRALMFDTANASTAVYLSSSYEQIDSTHRRYYLALQNAGTTDWVKAWICVAGANMAFTGFALGINDRSIGDVAWEDFDPAQTTAQNGRLTAIEAAIANPAAAAASLLPKSMPQNGVFAGGVVAPASFAGGQQGDAGPVAIIDTLLNNLGINYAVHLTAGSGKAVWWQSAFTQKVKPGEWLIYSYVVKTTVAGSYPTGASNRVIGFDAGGSQFQVFVNNGAANTAYEDLDSTHRRFYGALQVPARSDQKVMQYAWLIVTSNLASGADLDVTAFSVAASPTKILDLDWMDFDPGATVAQNQRLTAIESGATTVQATPDLLVQTSYHLLQGRPLRLQRDGLTSYRELIGYEIAALGLNGSRVGVSYASPIMSLDGNDFAGAGYFRAKKKGQDTLAFYQTPTFFYSSPAVKSGALKYHHIGDSLAYRGTIKAIYDRLTAAGLTVTMLGTLCDQSGSQTGGIGECRPNWKATDYIYQTRASDPTGTFYNLYPLRPNGGSGLTISTTTDGNALTGATIVDAGLGYPDGTWEVKFSDPSNTSTGLRARGTVTISGGSATSVDLTTAGTTYTAAATGSIVPSYAEYLTLTNSGGYGPRWFYNPYLRPATQAEVSAGDSRIRNGYIFDFQFYVSTFLGGTMPDQVAAVLGMNDLLKGNTPATTFAAIQQIVTAIRAASATVPIAVGIVGQATTTIWTNFVTLTKLLMAQYKGQETSGKLFLLPLFQVIDPKFTYDNEHNMTSTTTATDPQTGMQTVSISDPTHFDDVGRAQAAEMIFAWSLNRI